MASKVEVRVGCWRADETKVEGCIFSGVSKGWNCFGVLIAPKCEVVSVF